MGDLRTYDIVEEPTGSMYEALLAFAVTRSETFSLLWRHQASYDDHAAAVGERLRPFFTQEFDTSEWPGTTPLFGHLASVRRYRSVPEALPVLNIAGGLFAWEEPFWPEDLAFYTADGDCWLGLIAHQRDAFVLMDDERIAALRAAVPELKLRVEPE